MPTSQLQCPGCDKVFTPRGLSQHVSKTYNTCCHNVNVVTQSQSVSASFAWTAFPPALFLNHDPPLMGADGPCEAYEPKSCIASNKDPDSYLLSLESKFTMTCVVACDFFFFFGVCASESHISFTDEDAPDSDGHSDKPPDPTDVTDANAYEELTETSGLFIASTSHEPMIYDMLEATEDPEQQTNQNEVGILETTSAPVADQFPTRSAGAPIPGISHGISAYECQEGPVNSVWAL